MGDNDDSRLGLYAGVFAAIMVVALSLMALFALDPPAMQIAQSEKTIADIWVPEPNG